MVTRTPWLGDHRSTGEEAVARHPKPELELFAVFLDGRREKGGGGDWGGKEGIKRSSRGFK